MNTPKAVPQVRGKRSPKLTFNPGLLLRVLAVKIAEQAWQGAGKMFLDRWARTPATGGV